MSQFKNPWLLLKPEDVYKTSFQVSAKAHTNLARCHRSAGIMQTTVAILIEKFIHELERNNITDYDPAAYESALLGCSIQIGVQRSTALVTPTGPDVTSPGQAVDRDDRRGAASVARDPARPQESSDASSAPVSGSGNKRTRKKKQ